MRKQTLSYTQLKAQLEAQEKTIKYLRDKLKEDYQELETFRKAEQEKTCMQCSLEEVIRNQEALQVIEEACNKLHYSLYATNSQDGRSIVGDIMRAVKDARRALRREWERYWPIFQQEQAKPAPATLNELLYGPGAPKEEPKEEQ